MVTHLPDACFGSNYENAGVCSEYPAAVFCTQDLQKEGWTKQSYIRDDWTTDEDAPGSDHKQDNRYPWQQQ